jgi:hypothetical protein
MDHPLTWGERERQTKVRVVSHVAHEPPRADLAASLAERDARYEADNRTPADQWLGDPHRHAVPRQAEGRTRTEYRKLF